MDNRMLGPLRKVMAEFIRADAKSIILQRPTLEKTPLGGYRKVAWEIRPEQFFRLVPYKRRLTDLIRVMANGDLPVIQYVLVCPYNADVKRLDEFELDGSYYQVEGLEPHTAVEQFTDRKVAQLVVLGPDGVEWVMTP